MSVKKNTIYNLGASILPLMAAIYSIPELITNLEDEKFSILLIIWSLIGYFSLFDFGVGRALTYELSKIKNTSYDIIDSYIKSGIIIVFFTSIIGSLLVYILANFVVEKWYQLSNEILEDSINSLLITSVAVIPTTITSGLRGALEGLGKFFESNMNRTILGVSVFISPLVSVSLHGSSLTYIAIYLLIIRLLVMFISLRQLKSFILKSNNQNKIKKIIPQILNYGLWVSVSGITSPLMVYGDRFLLAAILGATTVTYYATPQEGLVRLLIIPGALAGALFHEFSSNTKIAFRDVISYEKKVGLLLLAIIIIIAISSHYFYEIWININFAEKAYLPTVIMSLGILFYSMGLIHITVLSSLGKVKYIGYIHAIELIIYVPLYYFLSKNFGIVGASIVWTTRAFIDFILLRNKSIDVLSK